MNIALIICIPITALVVGFLVLQSVKLGFRWQMNVKDNKEPELKTPIVDDIKERIHEHKQAKSDEETKTLYDEWVNGAKE